MEITEQQLAGQTLAFLEHVPLSGGDVPTFVGVVNWLKGIVAPAEPAE